MKLKDVMEKATKGPLESSENLLGAYSLYMKDIKHAINDGNAITYALLAHAYNMLPKLVDALEQAEFESHGCPNFDGYVTRKIQQLLAEANDVKGV